MSNPRLENPTVTRSVNHNPYPYKHFSPAASPATDVGGTRTGLHIRVEGPDSKTQIKKSIFNAFNELSNLSNFLTVSVWTSSKIWADWLAVRYLCPVHILGYVIHMWGKGCLSIVSAGFSNPLS